MNNLEGRSKISWGVFFFLIILVSLFFFLDPIMQYISPQHVSVEIVDSELSWLRDDSSLPFARSIVRVNIQNTGKSRISWLDLKIKENSNEVYTERITGLEAQYSTSIPLIFDFEYDTTKTITVEVSSSYNLWTENITINADLIRSNPSSFSMFYITPDDPNLGKDTWISWLTPNFLESLFDTYSTYNDITYRLDNENQLVDDYWQLPRETISLGYGDCEDQAILLCSYLRSNNVGPDNVFVVVGTLNNQGHAWVVINRWDGWKFVEPTAEGTSWFDIIFWSDDFEREIFYAFNDEKYIVENFPFLIN